jgi:thiosulfate dehydrogenase
VNLLAWARTVVLCAAAVTKAQSAQAAGTPAPAAAAVCQTCHGASGEGNPPAAIPRIAGQGSDYLEKQLRDYASGERVHPIMQNFAKPLTEADRTAIANYFSSLDSPYLEVKTQSVAAQLSLGHQLANQGSEVRHVQACKSCHGPDGTGVLHAAPFIGGQSAEYLISALKSFKDGTRKNDPGKLMSAVAAGLTDADILAAAAYFSTVANSSP